MSAGMGARDRTVLVAGIVVMAVVILLGRGVPWLVRETERRQARADVAMRAADRAESAVREAAILRRSLGRIHRTIAGYDSALVDEGSPALASARLAEVIGEAAAGSEARLGAVQLSVDSTDTRTALMRVRARATLNGDLTAIAIVLQSLEAGSPLMAVRALTISRSQLQTMPGQPESLQAELVVEGLVRRRGERKDR